MPANRFGGKCAHCGAYVEAGQGAARKLYSGSWVVECIGPCAQAAAAAREPEPVKQSPQERAAAHAELRRWFVAAGLRQGDAGENADAKRQELARLRAQITGD